MIQILHRFTGAVLFMSPTATTTAQAIREAIIAGADLSRAILRNANLRNADLSRANLSHANLSGADLSRANLSDANLIGANLSHADLSRANLSGANLIGANLSHADLSHAILSDAILRNADLRNANLRGADLSDSSVMPDGRSWAEYRADHLAGICQTTEIKAKAIAAWGMHTWQDCPMHCALGISGSYQAKDPIAVGAWVALYDGNHLAAPVTP